MNDEPVAKNAFLHIANEVARNVSIRNANLDPTKILTIPV